MAFLSTNGAFAAATLSALSMMVAHAFVPALRVLCRDVVPVLAWLLREHMLQIHFVMVLANPILTIRIIVRGNRAQIIPRKEILRDVCGGEGIAEGGIAREGRSGRFKKLPRGRNVSRRYSPQCRQWVVSSPSVV